MKCRVCLAPLKCVIQMQTWLHKSPLMYFINICSSPPHLSPSSNSTPSGNRQHHIWQLLFLNCILNCECSLYCVLLHNTLICVCAHTVILARLSTHFTPAHPGPIVPLWLMLISILLGGAGSRWGKWEGNKCRCAWPGITSKCTLQSITVWSGGTGTLTMQHWQSSSI